MRSAISDKAAMIIDRAIRHRVGLDDATRRQIQKAIREEAAAFGLELRVARTPSK